MTTRISANDTAGVKAAEARIRALTREAGSHAQSSDDAKECFKLRAQAAQIRQELDAAQQTNKKLKKLADATSKELHESEMGRKATEDYARKLEQKLERSGKGVALMKAVRLQSDVEFLERQSSHLYEELKVKDAKIEDLMGELVRQRAMLDEAARSSGLPNGWQSLEELSDLRLRVQSLADGLNERDDKIRRQQEDLNDFRVYRNERASIQGRLDELEAQLSQADDDKAVLMEAYDDQKRQIERGKALIDEMTHSRDEFAQRTDELERKKAELERLLREQVVIMTATKQQTEALEANLHQLKRSHLQLERERDELHHLVLSSEKQRSAMSIELMSMSEQMQGVLDLNHLQQAELHARANELTHRITSTLQGRSNPSLRLDDSAEGILVSLTRCSRQQEALIEQFLSLKDQIRNLSDIQGQNQQRKETVERREQEIQQLMLTRKELEKQLRDQSMAWAQLAVSTSGSQTYCAGKEMEVASHVLRTLSELRSSHDSLTFKLQEVTRDRERLKKNNEGLNEGMRSRQEAISGLVSIRDLNTAMSRIEQLEESNNSLRFELQKAHDSHMIDLSELTRTKERLDELIHRSTLIREEDKREKERLSLAAEEARGNAQSAMKLVGELQGQVKDREGEMLRMKAKLALNGGNSRDPGPPSSPAASSSYRFRSPPRSPQQPYESSFAFQPLSPSAPAPTLSPSSARKHQSPFFQFKSLSPKPAQRPRPRAKTPVSSSDDDSEVSHRQHSQKDHSPSVARRDQVNGKARLSSRGKPDDEDRHRKDARDQIASLVQTYKKLGKR